MSITITIPTDSQPIITDDTFTATFNVPTVGKYDFGIAANTNQFSLKLSNQYVYLWERVNFSLDIPEDHFKSAINVAPQLIVTRKQGGMPVFRKPFKFINYVDNLEILFLDTTLQQDDEYLFTFSGILNQTPDLVGIGAITALLQFNIYEIVSTKWKTMYELPQKQLGSNLALRGL